MGIEERAESSLGALRESALHVFTATLAAQKHLGTSADAESSWAVAVDSGGIYILGTDAVNDTVIGLAADLSTLTFARRLEALGTQRKHLAVLQDYLIGALTISGGEGITIQRIEKASTATHRRTLGTSAALVFGSCIRWTNTEVLIGSLGSHLMRVSITGSYSVAETYSYTKGSDAIEWHALYDDGSRLLGGVVAENTPTTGLYLGLNRTTFAVLYTREIAISGENTIPKQIAVSGDRLAFLSTTKIILCIDLAAHSVLWAKKITSSHTANDIEIQGSTVVVVGASPGGMLVLTFDRETGAVQEKNKLNTNGSLVQMARSGGSLVIAGKQNTETFGSDDVQVFLVESISEDSGESVTLVDKTATLTDVTITKTTIAAPAFTDTNSPAATALTYSIEDTHFLI